MKRYADTAGRWGGPNSGRTTRSATTLALAALAGFGTPASQAQTAPPAAAPSAEATTLPAVRATGQREAPVTAREATAGVLGDLPLLETPFSVNVVTRELIERQQAAFIGDLLKNDPSATVGNVAVPFLMLRGFSVGTDGTLYDGLPGHGGLSDGRAGLQMIDQVEVLKGASSFLHGIGGAGSLGGTINYLTKRPTDTPLRSVGVGAANRSLFSAEADLSDRFGVDRQFGVRANFGWRDGEQAVARYDWTQQVAALALDWRVRPGLVLNAGYDHIENRNPELPPFYSVAAGVPVPAAPDIRRSAAQPWDDFRTRSDNYTLRSDWDLAPDWSLTAQALRNRSARPTTKEARFGQVTNAAGDILLFGSQDVSWNDADSGQVLLHGRAATGAMRHKLRRGLSGSKFESGGGSTPLGVFASNLYAPVDAAEPAGPAPTAPLTSRTRSKSVLISDIVEFDERWSVLLGLRRARLEVDNISATTGARESRNALTKTLPTAALMLKPMPGALLYLNLARGLEQGGSLSPTMTTQFLPPLQTRQVELGAKLERNGLTATAALFDMKRPLETFDATLGRNVQRGQQRHRGVELTASGRAAPDLTLVSGLMLLNTRLTDTGTPGSEGKRAIGVPRLMANVWGEYRLAALPGVAVNAGLYHAGKQPLDAANTQWVASWTRLDLGASWQGRLGGVPTRLLLTVENAADKHYWASAQSGILTMADPLTAKLAARFDF